MSSVVRSQALHRRALAALLAASLLALHVPALAQTDEDRAGARAAATEGAKAFDEKRYDEAIDLFTRAESLVHAPPHLLFIARAHLKLGRLVRAREFLIKLKNEDLSASKVKPFHQAKADGDKELAALEPRIPTVKVLVSGAPEGKTVAVTMDGAVVPPALVGVPRPVDPGTRKFQATTDGYASEVKSIEVAEGGKETITLVLSPVAKPKPPPPPDDPTPEPPVEPAKSSGGSGLRIGAWVSLGVGAVGLGVGTVFLLSAMGKQQQADDLCPNGVCPAARRAEVDALDADNRSARTLSTVGFIVGGLGIATGITLFVLAGSADKKPQAAFVTPWVGLGSFGLRGAF